jgi:hypothetical protein
MIVQKGQRKEILVNSGVATEFLDAIDHLEQYGDLQFMLKPPEGAYFYLPGIEKQYKILEGFNIVPICDGSNGDSFYVLLFNENETKYVRFELECDEIYCDYGPVFSLLLADIVIEFYEFADDLSSEEIAEIGLKLGLKASKLLLNELDAAESAGTRSTFEKDQLWKKEKLPLIIGNISEQEK